MDKLSHVKSTTVVLPQTDIDTDQIMPARFLTTTTKEGLGDAAFSDWRYDKNGNPLPDFPLNQPGAKSAQVLVAGNNFGCGSSREHAPWGLVDFGFRAVVSTQLADIFSNNSLKNGLLPIVIPEEPHRWLLDNPGAEVEIDVAAATITLPGREPLEFSLDGFAKHCLLDGVDQLGFLLAKDADVAQFEQDRSWKP
jgi:3-isopropylmalate/(R)-2-methylmalate dehydratase small subunit